MTLTFVRYSPDVERADPSFEQNLQTVIEDMKGNTHKSVKAEGVGRAVRAAHAKGYGLARGEVEILDVTGRPQGRDAPREQKEPQEDRKPWTSSS